MCEPSHSIIQYSDPDGDNDNNGSAQGGYRARQLTQGLGKWTKKIKDWFHLSMMGQGHSETIGARASNVAMYDYHEIFALYEAHWWNRKVVPDGFAAVRSGPRFDCAWQYANQVSIGDMTQLRRFLETSMRNSVRPQQYADLFWTSMLNRDGRQQFESRFSKVFKRNLRGNGMANVVRDKKSEFTKFMLGFTRKRDLLVPEWADDNRIWSPSGKVVTS